MKGTLILRLKQFFRPYLPSHTSGVTNICYIALRAHALQSVQVRFKSVTNEGRLTHEAKIVIRLDLPSHFYGVTEICNEALTAHASRPEQVRLKSSSNEGH
jgi:hypothetical protein